MLHLSDPARPGRVLKLNNSLHSVCLWHYVRDWRAVSVITTIEMACPWSEFHNQARIWRKGEGAKEGNNVGVFNRKWDGKPLPETGTKNRIFTRVIRQGRNFWGPLEACSVLGGALKGFVSTLVYDKVDARQLIFMFFLASWRMYTTYQ